MRMVRKMSPSGERGLAGSEVVATAGRMKSERAPRVQWQPQPDPHEPPPPPISRCMSACLGAFELAHVAEPAADHAPDGLAGLRVLGQRRVLHALPHFKTAHGLFRIGRLVDVGGHGRKGWLMRKDPFLSRFLFFFQPARRLSGPVKWAGKAEGASESRGSHQGEGFHSGDLRDSLAKISNGAIY